LLRRGRWVRDLELSLRCSKGGIREAYEFAGEIEVPRTLALEGRLCVGGYGEQFVLPGEQMKAQPLSAHCPRLGAALNAFSPRCSTSP
jgi:hypothetical protein